MFRENKLAEKKELDSVKISFGTLFSVKSSHRPRTDCITDIGEDGWFFSGELRKSRRDPNRYKLDYTGTDGPKNFGNIVGQMTVKRVIEAFKEGARDGWAFNKDMERMLRKRAKKGSRVLLLKSE